jgi:Cu(I)/Ag(I) efflux system membrane fusion protein
MKPRLIHLLSFLLGGAVVWTAIALRHRPDAGNSGPPSAGPARLIRFYQSPMHPWIRSDKPGRCTICGMELVPVYEGEAGIESSASLVTLGTNSIQVLHVASEAVRRGPMVRTLRLSGTIDDNDQRHRLVSATVDARIERLGVNALGQDVSAGQVLAVIYSPALLAAEREYAALSRQASAHAGDGTGHASLLSAARQRLLQMGLLPDQIEGLAAKEPDAIASEIRTPAAGTVVAKRVYEGQYVKEGESLFELADFSTMWVQLDAYETDLPWIRPGQKVEVRTPSVPGRTFTGTVEFVDPNLDPMTHSTRVRVVLANPVESTDGTARRVLGHRLTASAGIRSEAEVLSVPRSAVLRAGGEPVAYVDRGSGAFERRTLRMGRVGDERIEVLDGLAAGERVVIQGAFLIDSQAQLNAGSAEPAGMTNAPAAKGPEPVAAPALDGFLRFAGGLSEALASDDLGAFRREVGHFEHRVEPVRPSTGQGGLIAPAAADLASLETARRWFVRFNESAVGIAKAARPGGRGADVRLFECPMTDRALPGGPKKAVWLQLKPATRNPYFGAAMIDCGNELKETP